MIFIAKMATREARHLQGNPASSAPPIRGKVVKGHVFNNVPQHPEGRPPCTLCPGILLICRESCEKDATPALQPSKEYARRDTVPANQTLDEDGRGSWSNTL